MVALMMISGCQRTGGANKRQCAGVCRTPSPVATATPDELAIAGVNYAKHCETCHGAEGEGGIATLKTRR